MTEPELQQVLEAIDRRIQDAEEQADREGGINDPMSHGEQLIWEYSAYQLRRLREDVIRIAQQYEPKERPAAAA